MKHLLIGPDGDSFAATAATIHRRLGFAVSGINLVEYAVRNLGCIELRWDDVGMRISARPRLVSPATVEKLALVTKRRRRQRVALMLLDDSWSAAIYRDSERAIDRLRSACRRSSTHPGWSLFQRTPLRLDDLEGDSYDTMHLLSAEWQTLGAAMDDDMRREFLRRRSRANMFLARPSPDCESVVLEHCSLVEKPWTSSWMRRTQVDLRAQPDSRYITWVTRSYRDVLATGRPRLERVRAELRCPELGARLFDYDRLVLPWRSPDGMRIATVVSVVRGVSSVSAA